MNDVSPRSPSVLGHRGESGLPRAMTRWRRTWLSGAVMAGDMLVILFGFILARFVHVDHRGLWEALAVTIPLYLALALNMHGFAAVEIRERRATAVAVRALMLSYAALFLLFFAFRHNAPLPRASLLVGMASSLVGLALYRWVAGTIVRRRLRRWLWSDLVILDRVDPPLPAHMRCIDAAEEGFAADLADPSALNRFGELVRDTDRVIVACPPEARAAWAMMLKGANVHGEVIVDDIAPIGAFGLSGVENHTTLVVASGPLTMSDRVVKRTLDLALCIPALIVLAPTLALIALAVKLDSRGPVFFRQRRVGRGNAFFEIMKFRSMHVALSDAVGTVSTGRSDPRVTRVGRLIRRTSIDELPQLFNVLLGSMSLVGPRPHALGSLAGSQLFWEVDDRYWHRHACKPGLTGLAQVRGFRGATHRREDLVNRLQADLEYLNGWTIWRDLSIMASTVRVIVHRNAF